MGTRLVIGKLMDERGMTVQRLVDEADIAYNTALNLKRGKVTRFDLPVLERVAKALGVTVGDLFETVPDEKGQLAAASTARLGYSH